MMKYQMIIMNIDVIVLMKLMNFEFNYFVSWFYYFLYYHYIILIIMFWQVWSNFYISMYRI
jgi:hypothetical protein